ncbi:MAG TPA: exodeoxyribonuclease VII small subunit [Gemmatimonadaceae bacterium]|jgi:exodeoxyribonuclease VII small subunit
MSYEDDLARIETIVAELERDDVALDRALALFEEGVERLRAASAALERAEAQVRVLVERADGTFELGDFRG